MLAKWKKLRYNKKGLIILHRRKNNVMSFFNFKKQNRQLSTPVTGAPEFIICGLGNPGSRYGNTRHNCGFMAADLLAEQEGFAVKKLKFKSLTALEVIEGVKCFIMKPTTFMNLSGEALIPAMEFYKIPPERTIVIFDDISLPLGAIRIRKSGSDGGHNGMKNIILQSNSDSFPRIKIGIGDKPHPDYPLKDWVTSPFKRDEGEKLESALEKTAGAVRLIIKGETEKAMNDFNAKV